MWQPDPSRLRRPAFLALAEQVVAAIGEGRLQPGDRLPTQRRLAFDLGLSVQTVSRAYEELIRRGLLSGETGRGTFVRAQRAERDPPFIPERVGDVIDLSILKPVCEPIHVERTKAALAALAADLPASLVLSFRPNHVFRRHREVAVEWLKGCGVPTAAGNVCLTNGASSAMTVALMATAPPGSTVLTEAIGHHTLVPLAAYLGLKLRGVELDREGILPDALARACQPGDARALFVQPSVVNPTASLMGAARRAEIVRVAREHDLAVIEADVLGPLVEDRPAPIAALAPERTLYLTSFTKPVLPGLRTGYLTAPDRLAAAIANRHLVSNWIATPLVAELATRWVEDGTALELVRWQRKALRRRQAIAGRVLRAVAHRTHPQALHVWLPLGPDRPEEEFVAHARLQGVAVAPGRSFQTTPDRGPPAVRISLGSTDEAGLESGLRTIARLLQGAPEPALLAI